MTAAGPMIASTAIGAAETETDTRQLTDTVVSAQSPWITVVWNDPVNLMSYVTFVFMKLLGHPRPVAEKLMLDVHHKGKASVSAGSREKMEVDVAKLQAAGLWATLQQDD